MITRRIRIQLIAFVLLAAVGIVYAGGKYADLGRLFTKTTYTVRMHLTDTGGIFPNAEVTYRGVDIGRVGTIRPTRDGAVVDLSIRKGAPRIPARDLHAEIKNLSVIGELYVDLTPGSTGSPYLSNDATIAASSTSTPIAPATLLASLDGLLRSVPAPPAHIVLAELSTAFSNGGADLGKLLDSSSTLLNAAEASLSQTTTLANDGAVVLKTQNETAQDVISFGNSLRLLATALKSADPDLNRLVATAPLLTTQVSDLLRESGPGFSHLVADLLTTARLADPRGAGLRQLLITYPGLARAAYSALPGDGTAHFGLVLDAFDPQPCTRGYGATKHRGGTDVANTPVKKGLTCAEPYGSPIDVRGTQNVQREPIPSAVPYPSSAGTGTAGRVSWAPEPVWADNPVDVLGADQ